jgi:hypothetical protein
MFLPKFKKDLLLGQQFEDEVLARVSKTYPKAYRKLGQFKGYDIVIPEKKIKLECKNDIKSQMTPNIAIEYEFNGKPSGISATKATHWLVRFYKDKWIIAIGTVNDFKKLCNGKKSVKGGDGYLAKMYLVPKDEILSSNLIIVDSLLNLL